MSPEIVKRQEYCGFKSDIWACGIILFSMMFGRTPFRAQSERELYTKIGKGNFGFPDEVYSTYEEFKSLKVSAGAKKLLKKILQVGQAKRPSAEDILSDEWLLY